MSSRKRDHEEHSSDGGPPSSPGVPSSLPPSSPPRLPFDDDDDGALASGAEVGDIIDDLDEAAEEEDGEDLFGDNMAADYRERAEQDVYDETARDIDNTTYRAMDVGARRHVDAMLGRRDQLIREGRGGAFLDGADGAGADGDNEQSMALPSHRRRRNQYDDDDEMAGASDDDDPLDQPLSLEAMADVKADSVAEWVVQPGVHKAIAREFKRFLLEYTDENGRSVYGSRIRTLGEVNSESMTVSYSHLLESKAVLAYFVVVAPAEVLKIFDVVAMEAIELHYEHYARIHAEVHVRISDLPTSFSLRDLREHHLNTLVRVTGVVTRRTSVFPQLKYIKFDCPKCGAVLGPYVQDSQSEVRISFCYNCQSRGPFILNSEKTLYRNYQRITLQESPGTVPAGRLPRHREVILLWDLIDKAKPGDEVDLTGIYKNAYDGVLNAKNGFPVFATVIEANNVLRRDAGHVGDVQLSEIEEREIRQLSRDPKIIDKIIDSIAPSIYGHRDIKRAIAASLFGGVPKSTGKVTLRGDINVLLMGDPGTAKSQILKYAEATASRAVFATGQGASAVGLTASVRKDPITREWTLEGGALVLADKGTCLIDEFDKMNDQDRTSIHEAMEQQSISISKAGIVASLQARCAVIAAANPREGRYNASRTLVDNVDLTEPILSRFDVLCVVQDLVNPENDERLAKFVVSSHTKSHPLATAETAAAATLQDAKDGRLAGEGPIAQELLRKYIHYARATVRPQLLQVDENRIAALYSQLRDEALKTGAFPITVRHLESIIRLSEAFAKMRLSEYVSSGDVDRAIQTTVDSFIQAQKNIQRRALRQTFTRFTYGGRL